MLEVVIYFVMAAVVCTMLYMVLGKQVGRPPEELMSAPEPQAGDTVQDMREVRRSRHFEGDAGEGLKAIAQADAGFDPDGFLDSAKAAYSMI